MPQSPATLMEKISALTKRRGFVFPSAEIYGGLGGFWDWGPLGVLLKNNIKKEWWKTFVQLRNDIVGIDGSIITNPKVWEASGHVNNFRDILIECKKCHLRYKADDILSPEVKNEINNFINENPVESEISNNVTTKFLESLIPRINQTIECRNCRSRNWTAPLPFNTMFVTFTGPVQSRADLVLIRPETAQNIFTNYELVRDSMRLKLPFGIAQIGKAFRNEITPGNFVFRSREFEQMEIEYFVVPGTDDDWFEKWVKACERWFFDLGLQKKNLRLRKQVKAELAHYSKATTDVEYAFPIEKGWAELIGISNRQDYDLKQHGKFSRKDYQAFATRVDDEGRVKKVPYVIEPSFGVDRAALAFLLDAYTEEKDRVVLRLHPKLAPYQVAVFPLLANKPQLFNRAREIYHQLQPRFMTAWDDRGNVGKRYYSQDEIGTPFCVTIDFDTLEGDKRPKDSVTVRARDSMQQENVAISDLSGYLQDKLA